MGTKPEPGDTFRIQLEGRLEVIERAQALQATLLRRLTGPGWRFWLRRRPDVLAALWAQEAALTEALERVERRARQEQWPEDHPARWRVRGFLAQRARLEARLRGRLQRLTLRMGASVPELLGRLEALVLAPAAQVPGEGELLLLHGLQDSDRLVYRRVLLALPLLIVAGGALTLVLSAKVIGVLYLLFCLGVLVGPLVLTSALRPGEFWLTRERLVWRTMGGQAVEVPLASIPPGCVVRLTANALRVEGDRIFTLTHLPRARELAELLEQACQRAAADSRASEQESPARGARIKADGA